MKTETGSVFDKRTFAEYVRVHFTTSGAPAQHAIRAQDSFSTVDGIAMAISRMAPSHFLWKKSYKCWDTVPQLCRLRVKLYFNTGYKAG